MRVIAQHLAGNESDNKCLISELKTSHMCVLPNGTLAMRLSPTNETGDIVCKCWKITRRTRDIARMTEREDVVVSPDTLVTEVSVEIAAYIPRLLSKDIVEEIVVPEKELEELDRLRRELEEEMEEEIEGSGKQ